MAFKSPATAELLGLCVEDESSGNTRPGLTPWAELGGEANVFSVTSIFELRSEAASDAGSAAKYHTPEMFMTVWPEDVSVQFW